VGPRNLDGPPCTQPLLLSKIRQQLLGVSTVVTKDDVLRYLDLPSASMREVLHLITRVAPLSTTVFINGPSGSGKEFVARAIHCLSKRESGPFIALNCGAVPRDLIEGELFGSEKGAYTGSVKTRAGLIEMAEGGTLFLDEIGDMPHDMQVKLLRVLEERVYTRIGGSQPLKADVRIVCATHRNLEELIADRQFREDLFYRINVFPIMLEGLTARRADIPQLVTLIAERFKSQGIGPLPVFTADAIQALQHAEWPGNVRQLRNTLERAGVLYGGEMVDGETMQRLVSPRRTIDRVEEAEALWSAVGDLSLVSAALGAGTEPDDASADVGPANGVADPRAFLRANPEFNLKDYIAEIEVAFIKAALAESANSVSSAARILGYQRTTLIERMRKFSVQREEA
jgi:sigma-54 specific flagellar transcriptional regulator A